MAEEQQSLGSLAAEVAELSKKVADILDKQGVPPMSFAMDSPSSYPVTPELSGTRLTLVAKLWDMLHLAMGPEDYMLMNTIMWHHNLTVIDVINQFGIWDAVPLSGEPIGYAALAARVKLAEPMLRRVLRYAFTMRLFREAPDGAGVAHTATTAAMARDPVFRSWSGHNLEEVRPAGVRLPEVLRVFGGPEGDKVPHTLESSAFAVEIASRLRAGGASVLTGEEEPAAAAAVGEAKAGGADFGGNFWTFMGQDASGGAGTSVERGVGWRARRFAQAMQTGHKASAIDFEQLVASGLDWASLPPGATVVDVGGSSGHEAVFLARRYANIGRVLVQDQAGVRAVFDASVPADLAGAGRVAFEAHDFFDADQPVKGADVYFLKAILHDWPDEYAARILRNLANAMEPAGKSRIILCEGVAPDPDGEAWKHLPGAAKRMLSAIDLQMAVMFNAKERTEDDWKKLLVLADPRLELKGITLSPGFSWGVLEVVRRE